jgi:hypothetical protein
MSEGIARGRNRRGPYVVFEDISGYKGFVDARVFVRFEVLEGVFRYTLVFGGFWMKHQISKQWQCVEGCRRTFARRHGGGLGDRRWERHGCKGRLGLVYIKKVRGHVGE